MGRFTDLFQENQPAEEVFAPAPVAESVEISAPVFAPESVSEEREVFNPNARDADGDGFIQEGTIHERPVVKKTKRH